MKRLFEGLSMIAIGLVLLACTTGALPWSVWVSIFSLWPLLLVSAGLDIIGNATDNQLLRVLSSLVFIGGLLYGAFVMQPGTWGVPFVASGPARSFQDSKAHDPAATEGVARVNAGATRLTVRDGTDMAAISGSGPSGAVPTLRTALNGNRADVTVDQAREGVVWGTSAGGQLDVSLDRTLRWSSVELNAGASDADIDLRGLEVEDFKASTGASQLTVTFGDRSDSARADISAGAASIRIRVPASAKVRLELSGALTSVDVPQGVTRVSGTGLIGDSEWTSEGTGPTIELSVKAGAASLALERY